MGLRKYRQSDLPRGLLTERQRISFSGSIDETGSFAASADRSASATNMFCRPLTICIFVFAAGGCQQRPTTVSGMVTLDGKTLSVHSDARGTVVFQPAGGQGTMATGLLDPTGHFQLASGSSTEIAPGKYHVAVSVVQLALKSDQAEQGTERITPARYASASESGLAADVAPGDNRLRFDLVTGAEVENSTAESQP